MAGPLTSIPGIPGATNTTAVSINADTGYTIAASLLHGYFGPYLKMSGFDGIILIGVSKDSVYIWINNGVVEIRDASKFWSKDTHETEGVCLSLK